jgi:hypothetical protein
MLALMTRRSHVFSRTAAPAVLMLLAAACGSTEPAHEAATTAAWTLQVQPADPPAAPASLAPQLTHSSSGVLASWIERDGARSTLRFAERTDGGWSPARTAAAGTHWFVSWADAPSVLRLSSGTLVANWFVTTREEIEAYDIYMARSADDGRTWTMPFKPHRDRTQTQHGFATLFETRDKGLGLVWLDGRDMENNTTDPEGGVMTLRYTSFDASWNQSEDIAVNARVCECCQTAAVVTNGGVVAAFRDRSEREIRDIAVSRLERGHWTSPQVVHADNWEVFVCPVNGPALATDGDRLAAAWFTVKDDVGHAYASFSNDAGNRWTAPVRLDESQSVGYVDVEMLDDGSAVATWVEFEDQRGRFRLRRIEPSGAVSAPIDVVGGDGRLTGYPRMARHGDELVFTWTESSGTPDGTGTGQQVKGAVARLPRTTAP